MDSTTLTVYGGWDYPGIPDFSPFCLKVKTYLRMVGVPYKSRLGDPRRAPTRKIPFIEDGGVTIGDSGLIIAHLKKKYGDPLDARLTADEHALGHVVRRTLEESAYWAGVYARWIEDDAWREVAKMLRPLFPPVIGPLIAAGPIRGGMRKGLFAQGMGRHTRDHIYALGSQDIDAVAAILGKKPYLLGDVATSYDAVLYGFVANIAAFPAEGPLAARIQSHSNLVAFLERMKTRYWATPDAR